MTSSVLVVLAGLLLFVAVGMLVAAYVKLRRQNFLIRLQSKEIEKQIRELIHQNQLSEQLLREKKQLIMLVSHDLKGPFNRIFALIQLLEMVSTNFTEEQKEYVGKMYQIVGDGLNMVRNLVDVRKLEERGVDPQPEQVNVAGVVTSITNQYRISAERKSIKMHLEAPKVLDFITDKNYLSRIMENLLSNAIKFSPADKNVFVTLDQPEPDLVGITVRDEGPGLSAEDQQKLYQKFQKLTPRPTSGESSTGLGLSIVKQLATSMGGDVTCKSVVDEGSTFIIRLPRMAPRVLSSAEAAAEAKIQLNK